MDRDYLFDVPYWCKHGKGLEPLLMEKSDIVLCNSPTYTENALKYNKNSFYIGNGCGQDFEYSVDPKITPEQLKEIKKPVIGYSGAIISLRLDINLLINIAKKKEDWNFVFVGPDDDDFRKSGLYNLPNVHYLGIIDKHSVPAYINHFDVCINPQLMNRTTLGNFPLKIIEYLLSGKPIVATGTDLMKEEFSEQTYLANGIDEYIIQIEKALRENSETLKKQRKSYAQKYSWDKIANQILSIIKNHEVRQKMEA